MGVWSSGIFDTGLPASYLMSSSGSETSKSQFTLSYGTSWKHKLFMKMYNASQSDNKAREIFVWNVGKYMYVTINLLRNQTQKNYIQ